MKDRIDKLLEKFYEGNTSVQEESELQDLLKESGQKDFESELFQFFEEEKDIQASEGFEEK